MDFIIFFLTHNLIFKYYLSLLLIFNIFMFYNFVYIIPKTNKTNITNNECIFMFKKLIKISKNPIIFEYQLEQINKIIPDTTKYIKYQKYIQNMNNLDNSNNLTYKYYSKIKQTLIKNKLLNVDEIIIKLLCINFS